MKVGELKAHVSSATRPLPTELTEQIAVLKHGGTVHLFKVNRYTDLV